VSDVASALGLRRFMAAFLAPLALLLCCLSPPLCFLCVRSFLSSTTTRTRTRTIRSFHASRVTSHHPPFLVPKVLLGDASRKVPLPFAAPANEAGTWEQAETAPRRRRDRGGSADKMGRGVGRQVAGVRLSVLGARGLKVVLPRAIPLSPIRCRPEFVGRPFAFWRLGVRGHPTGSAARSAGRTAEGGEWKEEGGKGGTVEDWKGGRREGWMGGREKAAWRGGGNWRERRRAGAVKAGAAVGRLG
jgi:hypothetical protein